MTSTLLIFAGIIAVLWLFYYFFSNRAIISRRLKKIPAGRIMNCKDGDVVRLTGKAEILTTALIAPLSKRKCVYYKVIVEQDLRRRNSSSTIIHDEKGINFLVREGNKIAVISTYKVRSFMIHQKEHSSGFLNNASEEFEKYLKRHGHSSENFLGLNYSMRYYESIIEVDTEVTVAGKVKWVPGSQIGLPDVEKVLYVKAMNEKHPLYLSSDPEMF